MKISYVLQLKDFSIMLGIGFLIGIFYGILNIFTIVKKNIILQIISDLIFTITSSIIFILSINIINMGQFRLFLIIGYILGAVLERVTLGKLFAICYKKVYTSLTNIKNKFVNSKLGRMILK